MLSHIDQFTDEQLMERALSGLRLEICMVIEQTPSQPMSYTKLAAITHQIEQSQRTVQRESALQAGLPQNPGGTRLVVAMAAGVAVSTVTTRVDVAVRTVPPDQVRLIGSMGLDSGLVLVERSVKEWVGVLRDSGGGLLGTVLHTR